MLSQALVIPLCSKESFLNPHTSPAFSILLKDFEPQTKFKMSSSNTVLLSPTPDSNIIQHLVNSTISNITDLTDKTSFHSSLSGGSPGRSYTYYSSPPYYRRGGCQIGDGTWWHCAYAVPFYSLRNLRLQTLEIPIHYCSSIAIVLSAFLSAC